MRRILFRLRELLFFFLSKLIIKKKNRWVFGSWIGEKVSDNSKWFYKYVVTNYPSLDCIYITKDISEIKMLNLKGGRAFKYGSLKSYYYILTSKVALMTHGYQDLSRIYLVGSAFKVNFWHASILIKKLKYETVKYKEQSNIKKKISRTLDKMHQHQMYIASSIEYQNSLINDFGADIRYIYLSGFPKASLFNNELSPLPYATIAHEIFKTTGFNITGKKIILYMPTYRDDSTVFSFLNMNKKQNDLITQILNKFNAVILEKNHYVDSVIRKIDTKTSKIDILNINNVKYIDIQEILFRSDMLITDYSSSYADFVLLDRPIIHYAYDYEYYKNRDKGFYRDITQFAAGSITYDFESLISEILLNLEQPQLHKNTRDLFIKRFLIYNTYNNCSNIFNEIKQRINFESKLD